MKDRIESLVTRMLGPRAGVKISVASTARETVNGAGRYRDRLEACKEFGLVLAAEERASIGKKVRGPEDIAALVRPLIAGLQAEHFVAVLLNTKNGIIDGGVVTVAVGSLNAALVHPRELFKEAIRRSAAAIVLAHNHPTGSPEPSTEDTELTLRFVKCGELLGIELIDHIILGDESFVSLRERGLIA